jgi:23S rRNA (pseudouridine1915-N3)-methyltransferase
MRIYLAAFGKIRTPGLRDSADYYRKMLSAWVASEEIELKPIAVTDKGARTQIQAKEAALLLEKLSSRLSPRGKLYLLEEGGKTRSTLEWADMIREWESSSTPEVVLCIGSSLGFAKKEDSPEGKALRNRVSGTLSLGPQTLSHDLARVVCLEQLYRAWSVTRGHPYHVEG